MPMSEAAREAQSNRMKARHAATAAAKAAGGGVAVMERDPEILSPDGAPVVSSEGAGRVSQSERFLARIAAQGQLTTNEDLSKFTGSDDSLPEAKDAGSGVTYTGPGLVWMFKRETWGWKRGKFSRNDVAMLLNSGYSDRCGDCGSPDCAGEINKCPRGKMRMYLDCPVNGCNEGRGRRFYDTEDAIVKPVDVNDPLAVQGVYNNSTPLLRLKGQVDDHIRWFHTQYAATIGLSATVTR